MNDLFESVLGRTLYGLLPAIYRERDNNLFDASGRISRAGDLARYLDASGVLLDRIRATLQQRLADAFPDAPGTGATCQEWLLPYVARLLDVRLVAPDFAGQRAEVANAITWRQRKGTLLCAEQIGEAILQREVELQEGWQRVALTPRVGTTLLPESAYGLRQRLRRSDPLAVAQHPGLPVATVDLRRPSQALRVTTGGAAMRSSRLGGLPVTWEQANRNGAPAHPGSFDDVSRRTVDLRTPRWNVGHSHPRRLLVYAAPPLGLFAPSGVTVAWHDVLASPWLTVSYNAEDRHLRLQNRSSLPVTITGEARLLGLLTESALAALPSEDLQQGLPRITVDNLCFAGKITLARGCLRTSAVVAATLEIATNYYTEPVLDATDCLFGSVNAPLALLHFASCTVLTEVVCGKLAAANTLLPDQLINAGRQNLPEIERIHHSRIPAALLAAAKAEQANGGDLHVDHCTAQAPHFFAPASDADVSAQWAVLSPATDQAICFGAEDGGEMGFFHHGRAGRPVHLPASQKIVGMFHDYELKDVVFQGTLKVTPGERPLRLSRCAVAKLTLVAPAGARPLAPPENDLIATSCLFGEVSARGFPIQLEYCTVFATTSYGRLHASDCVLAGKLERSPAAGRAADDCLRFSRIPAANLRKPLGGQRFSSCTDELPVFIEANFAQGASGEAGCGVLHPATPPAIANGAEDGGEMGAGHAWVYCLQAAALRDKLADHLPVGIEAVLIHDRQMTVMPPAANE